MTSFVYFSSPGFPNELKLLIIHATIQTFLSKPHTITIRPSQSAPTTVIAKPPPVLHVNRFFRKEAFRRMRMTPLFNLDRLGLIRPKKIGQRPISHSIYPLVAFDPVKDILHLDMTLILPPETDTMPTPVDACHTVARWLHLLSPSMLSSTRFFHVSTLTLLQYWPFELSLPSILPQLALYTLEWRTESFRRMHFASSIACCALEFGDVVYVERGGSARKKVLLKGSEKLFMWQWEWEIQGWLAERRHAVVEARG